MHSALAEINHSDRKIWTAEDPVEITQKGLRQVQMNVKAGLNFAIAMRAFLRADPDIIMVGVKPRSTGFGEGVSAEVMESADTLRDFFIRLLQKKRYIEIFLSSIKAVQRAVNSCGRGSIPRTG